LIAKVSLQPSRLATKSTAQYSRRLGCNSASGRSNGVHRQAAAIPGCEAKAPAGENPFEPGKHHHQEIL